MIAITMAPRCQPPACARANCASNRSEFDGKPLQSVTKGEVDLDSDDEKAAHEVERQEQERDLADLLIWLKETLSDRVKEVRLSARLTDSPACLITDTFCITSAFARMYRASGQAVPVGNGFSNLTRSIRLSPVRNRRKRTAATIPRSPKRANYYMAQPFSLKAAHPRARQSSPDYSRTGSRALCRTRPATSPAAAQNTCLLADSRSGLELAVAEHGLPRTPVLAVKPASAASR
jgi:hypothetical protein